MKNPMNFILKSFLHIFIIKNKETDTETENGRLNQYRSRKQKAKKCRSRKRKEITMQKPKTEAEINAETENERGNQMYTLKELALITGFTTRTLMNYMNLGLLKGEKEENKWVFSNEQVKKFTEDPNVRPGIETKDKAILFDFMAEEKKDADTALIMLDKPMEKDEAEKLGRFFADEMCKAEDIRYSFRYKNGTAHFIIRAPEETAKKIMEAYYAL